MARRSGANFGNFMPPRNGIDFRVKPIEAEFGGSVPNSLYTINKESSWSRWRRGYELATAYFKNDSLEYPFSYTLPLPPGLPTSGGNTPSIPGVFVGFPTKNKELGMHWAGVRLAGSLRFDNVEDSTGVPASIASITEDADYWYIQLAGTWSVSNPLPPPLYVPFPGVPGGLKPINGEILEDRVLSPGAPPITRDTINPATNTRYGYVQAVLVDTNPFTGVLTLRKRGSVEATPDRVFVTPATRPPNIGRFFITGTRYCCSCQDFTRRDYAYLSTLGQRKGTLFPRSGISVLKPGRYEVMTIAGKVANQAMTDAFTNRQMQVIAPSGTYDPNYLIQPNTATQANVNRDSPGVFTDFGSVYLRNRPDQSSPGSRADGMPDYNDYASENNVITSLTDTWTPLLDEFRYCKHIYALKYREGVFPPEPSDFPVGEESMADWEQKLVKTTEKEQEDISFKLLEYGFSYMDVPPYNCQAPMMMPMMQKLFNVPTSFILMSGFIMYDKQGNAYRPVANEGPVS